MASSVRLLRQRIRATASTKKITKAMELVATSRIAKAQERVSQSQPYLKAITSVLMALASNASVDHPLLQPRKIVRRAGVLVITSDRGLCGGYNANVIKTAEQLISWLRQKRTEVIRYVVGRKGVAYYRFRDRNIAELWTGFSEQPSFGDAARIGGTLFDAFKAGVNGDEHNGDGRNGDGRNGDGRNGDGRNGDGRNGDDRERNGADGANGVDELYLVHTRFHSLITQTPVSNLLAPMEVEDAQQRPDLVRPAYHFEPSADELLDQLLPKYINTRIYAALIEAAASESAARRRAMKAATDNAEELISRLTREMNAARQAMITQEISEIVGGVDALAAAESEEQ